MADGLDRLLRRVRRRLRAQRTLEWSVRGLALAGGPALAALALGRAGLGDALVSGAAAMAAVGLLAGLAVGVLARVPLMDAARALDRSHGLRDRVASAVEFVRAASADPFRRAAIADAVRSARRADPRLAAPLRRPPDLRAACLLILAASGAMLIRPLSREVRASPKAGVILAADDLLLGRLAAEDLARGEDAVLPDVRELGAALQKLYDDLDAGELPPEDLLARIDALEHRHLRGDPGEAREVRESLRRAGDALARERPTAESGRALREDDLARARAELQKLAEQAREASDADRRRLRRAMERGAQELARRQQRDRRDLERIERDERERAAQRRLDRLQREMERAGGSDLPSELAEALRQMADEMGGMEDEVRRLEAMERVRVAIADLKEAIRRAGGAGHAGKGAGKTGRDGKDGKDGRDGKGRMGDFLARAGRGGADGEKLLLLGQGGDASLRLHVPSRGEGGGDSPQPGDGIGNQHDPRSGEPTRIDATHRDVRADGADSPGPTRSEVILSASREGFSARGYRRVFRDYSALAEDVLEAEDVGAGRRQQVKRYFEMIRPGR